MIDNVHYMVQKTIINQNSGILQIETFEYQYDYLLSRRITARITQQKKRFNMILEGKVAGLLPCPPPQYLLMAPQSDKKIEIIPEYCQSTQDEQYCPNSDEFLKNTIKKLHRIVFAYYKYTIAIRSTKTIFALNEINKFFCVSFCHNDYISNPPFYSTSSPLSYPASFPIFSFQTFLKNTPFSILPEKYHFPQPLLESNSNSDLSEQFHFEVLFQINPPENPKKNWEISISMGCAEDPSLILPAAKVWAKIMSAELDHLISSHKIDITRMRSQIRQSITESAKICGDLKKEKKNQSLFHQLERISNQTSIPKLSLGLKSGYTFMKFIVPKLQMLGYRVQLPSWWGRKENECGLIIKVVPKKKKKLEFEFQAPFFDLDTLVDFDWEIALGKTTITPEVFYSLVELKLPLIHYRGQWIELDANEIEYLVQFMKAHPKSKSKICGNHIPLRNVIKMVVGERRFDSSAKVVDIIASGWLNQTLNILQTQRQIQLIDPPASLNGQLRPYQISGVSWMAFMRQFHFGVCLADDMGLGKTIQIIALLLHDKETASKCEGQDCKQQQNKNMHKTVVGHGSRSKSRSKTKSKFYGPSLIICPLTLIANWNSEIQKFAPILNTYIHHGDHRLSGKNFYNRLQISDCIITTYGQVLKDQKLLSRIIWQNIILDEAQNIKNPAALQSRYIKNLKGNYRIALTGTPIENRLSELWSIMDFLNPGFFGTIESFRQHFALPIEMCHDEDRMEELRDSIKPFFLRRVKTDRTIINDLPEKKEEVVFTTLSQEQATLYQACVDNMLQQIDEAEGIQRRGLILSMLTKLKQVCDHPGLFLHEFPNQAGARILSASNYAQTAMIHIGRSGKFDVLLRSVKKILEVKEKVLIFTQYSTMGAGIQNFLSQILKIKVGFLCGATPQNERSTLVKEFQNPNSCLNVFVLSLKAGGLGLNLTEANHVIHYDRWWNPAVENQASDRAYRIGQQRTVHVTKYVCKGTLEEKIQQLIEQKKELSANILTTGDHWITSLTSKELRNLITLHADNLLQETSCFA